MPSRGNLARVKVVNITGFDPSVLSERVVDFVFVIAISSGITALVSSKLEWIITILWMGSIKIFTQQREKSTRTNGLRYHHQGTHQGNKNVDNNTARSQHHMGRLRATTHRLSFTLELTVYIAWKSPFHPPRYLRAA